MNLPVCTENAEHYKWGKVCDGWHLLRHESLSIIEERMPPGTKERRHFHLQSRQFFYVLAGELTIELVGQAHSLTSGHGLQIDPGEPHQALNRSGQDVRFLLISQPPSHDDRQPV